MQSFSRLVLVVVLAVFGAACGRLGYETYQAADLGIDAMSGDAAVDAAFDAGTDASDLGFDSGENDAANDLGVDLSMDLGVAGFIVTPSAGLVTTEMGGAASFDVSLTAAPTADVTVVLASSDTSEGTVAPVSLTFTTLDWNAIHTVTVTGVDDFVADGPIAYTISTAPATSADARYDGIDPTDVSVSNTDDETPGVTVTPTMSLETTEAGGTDTYSIVLNAEPTSSVTISVVDEVPAEASASPSTLTFTTSNWASPQAVTVTGVDDAIADGDAPFSIAATASSSDLGYDGIAVASVTGTNHDDDSPGIVVTAMGGLTTSEAGGSAMLSLVLTSQPAFDVAIPLSSSDTTEGDVSATSVVFTTANWNVPRAIIVTGIDDTLEDGDQPYTVALGSSASADPAYNAIDPDDVDFVNEDDDMASFTVTPTSGLITTEGGGTATFEIALTSEPTASVVFGVTSSDTTEGTVSAGTITFTRLTWPYPQTVTVTGINDALSDGDIAYNVVVDLLISADPHFASLPDQTVSLTNTDDESPGITVLPTTGLTTTEGLGTATFTVVLNSQPTNSVTMNLSSDTPAEGTVSPASLTWTTFNWNIPQTVTVTGVNDFVVDGMRVYHIVTAPCSSTDPAYIGRNASDVTLTNADDDTVGITISPTTVNAAEGGAAAVFTMVLTSQPTADVVVPVHIGTLSQATIAPASRTFTTGNWNIPQSVSVTAVDDAMTDGTFVNTVFTDLAMSTDLSYNGFDAVNVTANILDNDVPSVVVTPTSGLATNEAGATASFSVVLTAMPSADVTISLTSTDTTEGTVAPASVTFTAGTWNIPQTVTVTGVDDFLDDGNIAYAVVTSSATSSDLAYSGLAVADVSVSNTDDDTSGVVVSPVSGLVTQETGATAQFTFVLSSQPTADVTVMAVSNDATEGSVSPASYVFTAANWNVPQTVTVTGVDDALSDGNVAYMIVNACGASADPSYSLRNVDDVSVTNTDNEVSGVTVTPTSGLVVSESGTTATFTVVLLSQPSADVTISLTSSDTSEGTVAPASLTFTPVNWSMPRTVTITGVNDALADGAIAYTIVTGTCVSGDPAYNARAVSDVSVSTSDDDSAGINVTPTSGLYVTEAGATATFTITLSAAPSSLVRVLLVSSNPAEGSVSPALVDLTSGNWSTPQTVTVTGVGDGAVDGDQAFTIQTAPAMSGDPAYSGLNAADVALRNIDDELQRCVTCNNVYVPKGGFISANAVSSDARYVVFHTAVPLVASDTNNQLDVYVRDRVLGTVSRASVTSAGVEATQGSLNASISDNGRFVCFTSIASSLVGGDTNGVIDIFLKDLTTGDLSRVSLSSTGAELTRSSDGCDVSDDGRYVAFSSADAAAPGSGESVFYYTDIFVRDTMLATTTWVSQSNPMFGDGVCYNVSMTPDAHYITYTTFARALGFESIDNNSVLDVYRYDRVLDAIELASYRSDNTHSGLANSQDSAISPDGRYIAFASSATNIVAGDTNGVMDVFLRDMNTNTTTRVSVSSAGVQANGASRYPGVSMSGAIVSFASAATNLVAGDTNGVSDAFVRRVSASTTTLLSRSATGVIQNGDLDAFGYWQTQLAPDGSTMVFITSATNIQANDADTVNDVFAIGVP